MNCFHTFPVTRFSALSAVVMSALMQDLCYAFRRLRQAPGFAAICLVTLALVAAFVPARGAATMDPLQALRTE